MVDAIEVGKVGAFCCTEVVDDVVPSFPFREGFVEGGGECVGLLEVEFDKSDTTVLEELSRSRFAYACPSLITSLEGLVDYKTADKAAGTYD